MRALVAMAALGLLVALPPAVAQHSGSHVSAGGHSGFSGHGGFGGHSSGPTGSRSFSGMHSGSGFSSHSSLPRSTQAFSHPSSSSAPLSSRKFSHFRGPREHRRSFTNYCYGYGCGWGYRYPYAYPYLGGGIDPYWWWDSGSSNDEGQTYPADSSDEMNAQNYEAQPGDQDAYAGPSPPAPRQEERAEASPDTVLIFRDQHRQEVQNYAIVGQTLWTFAPQHTQKIPLADLDLPATKGANEERGVDFHVPVAGQGQ